MFHNRKLTSHAQELRKNMTKEERKLWYEYLNRYPYRFRRQVAIGNDILDFYCAAAKLAVELDGSQHYETDGQLYDQKRTAYLNGLGIHVLRRFEKFQWCLSNDRYDCYGTYAIIAPAGHLSRPLRGHPPQRGGHYEEGVHYGTKKEGT